MAETKNSATRERILDVAEYLFMAYGYEAASMRQLTSEANVNLAAVNYHFGSKEALMQQVLKRRLDWLDAERLRVLDEMEAEAAGKPLKPSQIVDGYFGTLLRMGDSPENGGTTFLRLLGRTFTEPTEFIRTFLAQEYRAVADRYKQALFKALPEVPKAEVVWRFHFMLGATSYAIADTDALRLISDWIVDDEAQAQAGETASIARADRLLPRLMSFLLGGLRAPLPQFDDTDSVG